MRSLKILLIAFSFVGALGLKAQTTDIFNTPGTHSWTVPACVTSITVDVWAGGGGGGAVWSRFSVLANGADCESGDEICAGAGGGGGGGYVRRTYAVTPGQTYTIVVGAGGVGGAVIGADPYVSPTNGPAKNGSNGGNSTFSGPATVGPGTLTAFGGNGGQCANVQRSCLGGCGFNHNGEFGIGGTGGSGLNGTTTFSGGNGAAGSHSSSDNDKSGAGGGGAGTAANGGNASTTTAGLGGSLDGGNGADGNVQPYGSGYLGLVGSNGSVRSGGGSGASSHHETSCTSTTGQGRAGGSGARGEVRITYTVASTTPTFTQVSAICSGDPLSPLPTTSNNGINGSWSPSMDNTTTTTYTFTPTAGQCASTTTMQITVNPTPTISVQPQNIPICATGSGTLTATASGGTYQWQYFDGSTWGNVVNGTPAGFSYTNATTASLGITTSNAANTAPCTSGQYRLLVGSAPCQVISNTVTATVVRATRIAPTGPQCSGTPLNFDACPSGATYSWSVTAPGGTSATPTSGSAQTFSFTPTNITGSNQIFTVNSSVTYLGLTCPQTFSPTIVSAPDAGTISGTSSFCASGTTTLSTNGQGGGTWSSSNTSVATVNASGDVTAVSAGSATISYTVNPTAPCATPSIAIFPINVVAAPNAGTISGTASFCESGSATLTSNGDPGGSWSSSNTLVATVDASGNVTAIAVGSATISYTVNPLAPCASPSIATYPITVSGAPDAGAISGTTSFCEGGSATLTTNGQGSGTWSSTNPSVATVNASGVVTAVAAGTATISYTVNATAPCVGNDIANYPITVAAAPNAGTISGTASFCESGSATLTSNGDPGGTWSSSNALVATVDASGNVTANAVGSATISYTVNPLAPCVSPSIATYPITVSGAPDAGTISGTVSFCEGGTAPLTTNGQGSGTWSSSNTLVATVDAAGLVTAIAAGTATISYTVNATAPCVGNDIANYPITVAAAPNAGTISGTASFCESGSATLTSNGDLGGTWSSSNTSVATVDASGNVTAVASGAATITYTVNATVPCAGNDVASYPITVVAAPNAGTISGTASICASGTSALTSNGQGGGTWSSSNTGVATVDASGVVTAISAGSATISYTVNPVAPCSTPSVATYPITVVAAPNAGTISGTASICESATSSLTSNGQVGGTWSSSNSAVATVNASGVVTAVSAGSATISYTVNPTAPCSVPSVATYPITVVAAPDAGTISGTATLCPTGTASFTSNGQPGGTWSSSNTLVATVDASGLVTAVASGTATISYTVNALAPCLGNDVAAFSVTVTSVTDAGTITGTASICEAGTSTFTSNGNPGGVWSSSNTSVATVDASGIVSAIGAGTATISYTVTATAPCVGSDVATFNVTVIAAPDAGTISGTAAMCESDNASFSSIGDAGGSWTSSNTSVATVDAAGNVTAVGQGSATISYTVVATSPCTVDDIATFNVTVSGAPNAGTIAGTAALCDGETVNFTSNGDAGGNWTTSDATIATVDASGNVTAVGQGSATITYTVNAVAPCVGNDIATFIVTITAAPNAGTITGTGALCETGTSLFTSDGDAGGSWTSSDNAVATVDASGNVTAVGAGTATITYTVAAISPCTIDAVAQFDVSVTAAPNAGIDGDVLICNGEGVTSSSLFSELGGTPDAAGTWSPQPAGAGVYTYTVSAAAPCLNPATAIVIVTAENCEIIIPSGFTPGGDGENDTWEIIGLDEKYPDNLVIIYNRWGNEIYRSKQGQYSQAPWDGKYNGNEMPVSSYYYMILPFGEETEKEDILNGTITIIKE